MNAAKLGSIAAAGVLSACGAAGQTDAAATLDRMGVYIPVKDLTVSEAFYDDVLGRSADLRLPDFIGYTVGGGLFAIVSHERFAPDDSPGGATPYIAVSDVEALHAQLLASHPSAIEDGPLKEPGITILKLRDPDGYRVEFYSITSADAEKVER